jgi:hypothetical protein
LDAQRIGKYAVMTRRKAFQITQALALAQDPQDRDQQQIPRGDAHSTAHAGIRDRPEKTNQIEIAEG